MAVIDLTSGFWFDLMIVALGMLLAGPPVFVAWLGKKRRLEMEKPQMRRIDPNTVTMSAETYRSLVETLEEEGR